MNPILFASHKNLEYKDEHELRVFAPKATLNQNDEIEVEIEKLVEKFILSPYLKNWEKETLKNLINKFGYKDLVFDSVILKRNLK